MDVMNCAKTVENVMRQYTTMQSQREFAQRRLSDLETNREDERKIPYKKMKTEDKRMKPYAYINKKAADTHVVLSNEEELNKAAEDLKKELKEAEEDERVTALLKRLAKRLIDGGFTKK